MVDLAEEPFAEALLLVAVISRHPQSASEGGLTAVGCGVRACGLVADGRCAAGAQGRDGNECGVHGSWWILTLWCC